MYAWFKCEYQLQVLSHLFVAAPTVSLDPSSDVTLAMGDSVELFCQAIGWPPPTITVSNLEFSNA